MRISRAGTGGIKVALPGHSSENKRTRGGEEGLSLPLPSTGPIPSRPLGGLHNHLAQWPGSPAASVLSVYSQEKSLIAFTPIILGSFFQGALPWDSGCKFPREGMATEGWGREGSQDGQSEQKTKGRICNW